MTETTTKRRAKRRGSGEGSIFQRADGKWAGTIVVGYSGDGRRLRRTIYGPTKKSVTDKLTRLQGQKLDGTLTTVSKTTVGDYLTRWLEDAVKLSVRPSTYQSYEQLTRLHIAPRIGGLNLSKLTPAALQGYYADLSRDGKSRRLQQQCHAVIHRALTIALKWGLVTRNVADAVDRPTVSASEVSPLTTEQTAAFLKAAASDRLNAMYVLAVTTGCRQGELFALRWHDLDLEAGMLQVRRTLVEVGGEFHYHEPKTAKGRRTVHLPAMAVTALREHQQRAGAPADASDGDAEVLALSVHRERLRQDEEDGGGLVFCDHAGGPLRRQNVARRSFAKLLVAAGLPKSTRFHDLRHGHATMLLKAGINPRVVQERLGHSQISVTLGIYSHVLPTMQEEAAARVNALLSVKSG